MCGILGEISVTKKLSRDLFGRLLELGRHRGPDGQKIWSDEKVNFGFNRLSILDVSENGMQPFISPSGRYVIMLNGEIYNYRSLQKQYNIKDTALRSGSDVEVVAHMTDIIDIEDIPVKLNGMFALAIYDTQESKLLLARDFAGIKPLFYTGQDGLFVFASQFDQVFKHPEVFQKLQVNSNGVRDYMELGYMQAPNTIYKDIYQLKPGEQLVVNSSFDIKRTIYLSYPTLCSDYKYDETSGNTVQRFEEIFESVVDEQLVSDVPIGTFLSGGIDSPLVTAVAKKKKKDLKAFIFDVKHGELSEFEQAKTYADSIHADFYSDTLNSEDVIGLCEEHFSAYSEPFGDPSSLPTYIITKLAKKHLTVLLSGDGGDELFWGYPRFINIYNSAHYYKYPKLYRKTKSAFSRYLGKRVSYAVNSFNSIGEWQLHMHTHLSSSFINEIFGTTSHSPEVDHLFSFADKYKPDDIMNWLRWNEYYAHMQRILIKVDRASMRNSLEVRVPFLDKRVLDFAWTVKPELGVKHTEPKLLLKKAMEIHYPQDIIYKKKKGFAIPYDTYLRNELRKEVEGLLLDTPLFGNSAFDEQKVKDYVHSYLNKNTGNGWGVWILYAMQKWHSNFVNTNTILLK